MGEKNACYATERTLTSRHRANIAGSPASCSPNHTSAAARHGAVGSPASLLMASGIRTRSAPRRQAVSVCGRSRIQA